MKITREGTDLIISDNPGCIWLLGAFFIAVGSVFVFGGSGGYVYLEQHPRWVALHLSCSQGFGARLADYCDAAH